MKKNLCIFMSFILLPSLSHGKKDDPVVATVNGSKIHLSTLNKKYYQNLLYISNKLVTKENVLRTLINRELGIQNAKNEKLQNDSVVKEKMEDVLYHAKISKDLEPMLKKIVVNDKDLKNY